MSDSIYFTFWKWSEFDPKIFGYYRIGYPKFSDQIIRNSKIKKLKFSKEKFIKQVSDRIWSLNISDIRSWKQIFRIGNPKIFGNIRKPFSCLRYFRIFENETCRFVFDLKIFGYPIRKLKNRIEYPKNRIGYLRTSLLPYTLHLW